MPRINCRSCLEGQVLYVQSGTRQGGGRGAMPRGGTLGENKE